ncbi:GNAT family acetyltransferase [Bhargavaea cecembensis]|uniref:GNAT family acetyltransferase n=1 Tax=Bhargavaea cecembensis TaxID=394098 RepID=A0A161RJB1_9BACL|nr:GNAT family acetyltransferase [Bhargavaea cecembensis]
MVRRAKAGDEREMASVHVASWKTTYRGIVSEEYLESLKIEEREESWKKGIIHTKAFVAEEERGIVGFANGGPERSGSYPDYDGELYAIYLLKECQGQGTGQNLVRQVAGALKKAGFRSLLVRVLQNNPSRHFYEALGGIPIGTEEIEIGGDRYSELVYGWPDLNILIGKDESGGF